MPENDKFPTGDKAMDLTLKDLLDIETWQKIQDNFASLTEVGLRTLDAEGRIFTNPSSIPRLCRELLQNHHMKEKICGECLPTFLGGSAIVDKNLIFSCRAAGMSYSLIPLRIEDRVLGYVISGPVILIMRKSKEEYLRIAEDLNLSPEDFLSALTEIKVASFQWLQSETELIRQVSENILKLSYQLKTLEEKKTIAPDPERSSRLLNALLDVAFHITGADIGSIMMLDKGTDELRVRAARGLDDQIAQSVKVKLGDGISGIAAQEGETFLIREDTVNNRIKKYIRRPYLGSSMIVPIKIKNEVLGVINLGTLKTSPVQFDTDNVQTVNKIISLAVTSL